MYNQAPQSGLASLLASRGRGEDTMLVHMTPGEVQALQDIAVTAGGSLSRNPNTGLPEAGFLKELLPTIAGGFLKSVFPGLSEVGAGLITAGIAGLIEGDLKKGLTAGMEAYGGAKLTSAVSEMGRRRLLEQAAAQEALAKAGQEKLQEATAEQLGLTPKAIEDAIRPTRQFGMGRLKSPIQLPGMITDTGVIDTAFGAPIKPTGIRSGYVPYDVMQEKIKDATEAALAIPQKDRASSNQMLTGLRSIFSRGSGQEFIDLLGGPQQAGFVAAPILGAIDRAEVEKNKRKFARSQTPNYYYMPGAFDFQSGTFAPGGYYTAPGQPYTPKIGFAEGGVVFQEGGETNTEALEQYYQGLLTPPDTSQGEARRAETLAYISALNQQLKKPPVGDIGQAPPGSGGTDIVGSPGGGSSIVDTGNVGPNLGFDPSAGYSYPGQSLDEFLRESRTSTEKPVEEPELRSDEIAQPVDEPSALDEALSTAARGVTAITDPYLNFVEQLPGPDWLKTAVVPGFGAAKAIDEAAKKFIVNPVTLEGEPIPSEEEKDTYGTVVQPPPKKEEKEEEPLSPFDSGLTDEEIEAEEKAAEAEKILPRLGEPIDYGSASYKSADPITDLIMEELARRKPVVTVEELPSAEEFGSFSPDGQFIPSKRLENITAVQEQLYGPAFQGTSTDFDPTAGGTYDPGSALTPNISTPFAEPYNPLEQDPFGGRGIGLSQMSGAMGPGYNFGFAAGGIVPRMQYAAGGKLLNGPGDGMSDDIKANIDGEQEARLADGEFVIPADVVSHLGNGSTKAGAQKLYAMMDRVRKARTGSTKQGREINPNKFLPA